MDRPILFKDEMVRAILEGRKTQTRRILDVPAGWSLEGPQGSPASLGKITSSHPKRGRFGAFIRREIYSGSGKFTHDVVTCKYGEPGDRLWVREAWQGPLVPWNRAPELFEDPRPFENPEYCQYRADGGPAPVFINADDEERQGWRPSIHMPRWASRITLEITDVRVERLQDISEEDAKAEGAQYFPDLPSMSPWGQDNRWSMEQPQSVEQCLGTAKWAFANYFCKIAGNASKGLHDPRPWDANPWVWVIEFRRVE